MTDWADETVKGLRYPTKGGAFYWVHQDIATALRKVKADGVMEFARAILHGDDIHKGWLLEAAEAFIGGKPMPLPRDGKIEKGET